MNKNLSIAIAGGVAAIVIAVVFISMLGMQSSTTHVTKITPSTTEIQATEIDETYRWKSTDSQINPTLTFVANTENTIKVKNTTDEKHEFVIESNGKEVATSGDINPDSSAQFSFKPAPGKYEYFCEYHPTTMKGTIEITEK